MQRERGQRPRLVTDTVLTEHGAADPERGIEARRDKLICDLRHILAELDALDFSLAAIHVDSAICAIRSKKA